MNWRRAALLSMVIAAVVLTTWWLLYLPRDAEAVYRTVPAGASVITVHELLADRWDSIANSGVAAGVLNSIGINKKEIDSYMAVPGNRRWFKRLANETTVFAYVPELGRTRSKALVFSSWAGRHGRFLRWLVMLHLVDGVERTGMYAGRPIWTVQTPVWTDLNLSMTICDGVLAGCLSSESNSVTHLIDAYDGLNGPRSILSANALPDIAALWTEPEPDRGWFRAVPEIGLASHSFALAADSPKRCLLRFRGNYELSHAPPKLGSDIVSVPGRLLGEIPEVVVFMPSRYVADIMGSGRNPPWSIICSQTIRLNAGPDPNTAFIAMFGEDYRARLTSIIPEDYRGMVKNVPIPGLLFGVQIKNQAHAQGVVERALDLLNARCRFGVIPREVLVGDIVVTAIEGTGIDLYSRFPLEERVAYAFCDDWFLVCNSMDVLSRLLTRYQQTRSADEALTSQWMTSLMAEPAQVFVWTDVDSAGVTLNDALGLWLLLSSSPREWQLREQLKLAMDWVETARLIETISLHAFTDGPVTRANARIIIGPES